MDAQLILSHMPHLALCTLVHVISLSCVFLLLFCIIVAAASFTLTLVVYDSFKPLP